MILPDAIYLPPAAQADFLSAVTTYQPEIIGLIDGVFSQSLSVWHKEILYALEQGIVVYGASSMGALRAIETAPYGMIGVGEVYQMYASGEINDDDEVALLHSSADCGYSKVSEPMVNIRKTLELAQRQDVIDAETCQHLITIAKRLFYPERVFSRIFRLAQDQGISSSLLNTLQEFIDCHYVDIKKLDAIELLQVIRDRSDCSISNAVVLTRSHLFETLYHRDRTVNHHNVDIPLASISTYAALHLPDFMDINSSALNRELVCILAETLNVQVDDEEIDDEINRFCLRYSLQNADALSDWSKSNDLSPTEFRKLMQNQAICRKMQRWLITRMYLERTTKIVLNELRLRNRYTTVAQEAALAEKIAQNNFPHFEETSYVSLGMSELITDHLRETSCFMDTHFSQWLEEAAFKDVHDLRYELLKARLVRHFMTHVTQQLQNVLHDLSSSAEQ